MNYEKCVGLVQSVFKHPDRALVAAVSEITRFPIQIKCKTLGDANPIFGMLPDAVVRMLYLKEGIRLYEPDTANILDKIVKPKSTTLVIGAHIGIHAIRAKQLAGQEGLVIAFEPTPDTYALLEKNCRPRNIRTEQLAITRNGISKIDLTVFDIRHSAWNSTQTARSIRADHWNPHNITVPATSIDTYCSIHNTRPDVLILDLENGEMDAIKGGQSAILSSKPDIIIECGDAGREAGNSTHACLSLLQNWGYTLFDTNNTNCHLHPHEIQSTYPDDYPNILAIEPSKIAQLY